MERPRKSSALPVDQANMRRRLLKCMLGGAGLALAGGAAGVQGGRSFASIPKSLWVWRTPLAQSAPVLDIVRGFGFGTVFYSIPPDERTRLLSGGQDEAAAVRAFAGAGADFYAVSGDPAWCRHGDRLPRAVWELLEFQGRSGLFKGLCLDVEPQALPEWKQGLRDDPIRGYLELLGNVGAKCAAMDFPLVAAVVPFYARIEAETAGRSVLEAVAERVPETVLMAYRSSPDAAMRIAQHALDQLDAANKPWWFGVSTYLNAAEGISYAGATLQGFSSAMTEIDTQLGRRGSRYRGIAINDYPSLTEILRR